MNKTATREHWFTAADGTRLFARDEGPLQSDLTPLLCLPGLTRHSKDFDPVFAQCAAQRRVIAMDFRGRGRSAYAADPASYRPDVELQDTLSFLDHLNIRRVALLGTSRGGIVGMLMAAMAKDRLAGLLLNDIGCSLNTAGLLRIKYHVMAQPRFATWAAAADSFLQGSRGFQDVSLQEWETIARQIYVEHGDGIGPQHDPRLADNLPSEDDIRNGKVGELWALLPALNVMPLALLHGAGSDLLTRETVERMQALSPHLITHTIAGRGHVPFLDEATSVAAIARWLKDVDQKEKGR